MRLRRRPSNGERAVAFLAKQIIQQHHDVRIVIHEGDTTSGHCLHPIVYGHYSLHAITTLVRTLLVRGEDANDFFVFVARNMRKKRWKRGSSLESVVSHITRKTEAEAIYTRERQRMNRERFRAYYADFHAACGCRDYRRIAEVVQDATTITNDTLRLVRRMREIRSRRRARVTCRVRGGACVTPDAD